MITTNKLNNLIDAARKHVTNNFYSQTKEIMFADFCNTKEMMDFRRRFEAETDRIAVDYQFETVCLIQSFQYNKSNFLPKKFLLSNKSCIFTS